MEQNNPTAERHAEAPHDYQPPRVERVLTSDDLVREVQYAGIPFFSQTT